MLCEEHLCYCAGLLWWFLSLFTCLFWFFSLLSLCVLCWENRWKEQKKKREYKKNQTGETVESQETTHWTISGWTAGVSPCQVRGVEATPPTGDKLKHHIVALHQTSLLIWAKTNTRRDLKRRFDGFWADDTVKVDECLPDLS